MKQTHQQDDMFSDSNYLIIIVVQADLCMNPSETALAAHMTTSTAPKEGSDAGVYQKITGKVRHIRLA